MHGYPIALTLPERRPWNISEGTPLCCALEAISADGRVNRETLLGMPWFSPILGSGCLDIGDGPDLKSKALAGLKETIEDATDGSDDAVAPPLVSVLAFVKGLVAARAPGTSHQEPPGAASAASRLVAIAALLTEAFHEGSQNRFRPIGHRFLRIPIPVGKHVAVIRGLVTALRSDESCSELATLWGSKKLWKDLADHIHLSLNQVDEEHTLVQAVVTGADVQLLTEFAWLAIVSDSSSDSALYPGWSDLLVALWGVLPDGGNLQGIRNASTNLASLADDVSKILGQITANSWKSWISGPADDERRKFYAAIAGVLSLQGTIRESIQPWNPQPRDQADDAYMEQYRAWEDRETSVTERAKWLTNEMRAHAVGIGQAAPETLDWSLPRPVAVVTSFDLELEMAFWSAGTPFVEVLPVLAKPSVGDRPGAIVWLAAKFDPVAESAPFEEEAGLAGLRNGPREWFPLTKVLEKWSNEPTIIRLSGSPMINVSKADLSPTFYDFTGFKGAGSVQIIHALTIDEYSSLTFAAHELYSLASGTSPSQGLPSQLLRGTSAMARVWVSFGLQVDDAAVRTRLFSQLSVSSIQGAHDDAGRAKQADEDAGSDGTHSVGGDLTGHIGQGSLGTRTNGVAFNRRFNDADTAVMRWLGFEFNEWEVRGLIEDIHYCGDHLDHIAGLLAIENPEVDPVNWGRALPNHCPLDHQGGLS